MFASALGLALAPVLSAQETDPVGRSVAAQGSSVDQQLANTIADHLRQSGQLRHYTIDIAVRAGTAELSGQVADQPQREEALNIARGVPGVDRVLNRLAVGSPIQPAQAGAQPPALREPSALASRAPNAGNGAPPEPTPIFAAAQPSPYDLNPPKMPPYAWPSYAPYNNYSRVAYPLAYPYQAFPFIGPCYPFPKVPLGWRSVRLLWEDGHWWFSKVATPYDWWHLRYW
jgi:hypothetical protein